MIPLRFGIIGAGGISAILHLPEIGASDQMEVVLVSGRKAERLQRVCDEFDVPRWTQSYEDVLSDPQVDAVIIATPHPLHVSWGIKALEAGKHVLMQKPLCGDLSEADAFVSAVEESDRTVLCMPHFPPHVYDLQARCAAGEIGRVSGARCRTSHGGPEVYYTGVRRVFDEEDEGLWFFDASQASVGALFDMGVYAVASLVAILGSARRVTALTTTFDKPTQLEDNAVLVMEMAEGALVTAETSWCDPARSRELSLHGTSGKFTMPGTDGAPLSRWTPTSYTDERAPVATQAIDSGAGMGNVHEHFLDCVRRGTQPSHSHVWAARHVTEIMLAGMAADRDGRAIELKTSAQREE